MGESPIPTRSLRPADVFAILPLHQEPVYSGMLSAHGRPIWLLDPLDMIPSISDLLTREAGLVIYVCSIHQDCNLEYLLIYVAYLSRFGSLLSSTSPWQLGDSVVLTLNRDPLHWWRKFASTIMMDGEVNTSLAEELSSSHLWQSAAYSECNVDYFHGAYIHFCRSSI